MHTVDAQISLCTVAHFAAEYQQTRFRPPFQPLLFSVPFQKDWSPVTILTHRCWVMGSKHGRILNPHVRLAALNSSYSMQFVCMAVFAAL